MGVREGVDGVQQRRQRHALGHPHALGCGGRRDGRRRWRSAVVPTAAANQATAGAATKHGRRVGGAQAATGPLDSPGDDAQGDGAGGGAGGGEGVGGGGADADPTRASRRAAPWPASAS
jgi:hypothetical protein